MTNDVTGELCHCITSDAPIDEGAAPTCDTETYIVEKYEFENKDDGALVRAREVLDNLERPGATPAARLAAPANIRATALAIRFDGFKKVPAFN
jgi:hypothetical protein